MPWLSIAAWLVTFFLSKSKGASNGKAALLATGVGLATYYVADPSNQDNVLGIGVNSDGSKDNWTIDKGASKAIPGDTSVTSGAGASLLSTVGGVAQTAASEVGSTLRSWGPVGTLGVVAGTTALSAASDGKTNWLLWGGIALGAILLLK